MKKIAIYLFKFLRRFFYGRIVIKEIQGIKYKSDLSQNIHSHLFLEVIGKKIFQIICLLITIKS